MEVLEEAFEEGSYCHFLCFSEIDCKVGWKEKFIFVSKKKILGEV